ncbi:MAG: hypothetical protein HIU82_08270 [Proteobacteria bacterium]|nr:hypothetical protein [Pseudomonadota bacterium]
MTDGSDLLCAPSHARRSVGGAGRRAADGPGTAPPRPAPDGAPAERAAGTGQAATALGRRLAAAERAARAGQFDIARALCADALQEGQPLLAGSARLLYQAVAALLYSRAFGQIARLLVAVQGRRVRFRTGAISDAGSAAQAPAGPEPGPEEEYVLDPTRFAAADGEQVVRRWAAALAAGPGRAHDRPGPSE